MLVIMLVTLFGLILSAVVFVYVAFPHRGEEMPVVPQIGEAMRKGVDVLPTLQDADSRS